MMPLIKDLVDLLTIAMEKTEERPQVISRFQKSILESDVGIPKSVEWEILRELAYDLDYYEPNNAFLLEDPSFYGDEQLEEVISKALEKLDFFRRK